MPSGSREGRSEKKNLKIEINGETEKKKRSRRIKHK